MRWLLAIAVAWRLFGRVPRPRFPEDQEHPWMLPGRTVFVGGREFVIRESGAGDDPPILLIHGLGGSALAEWYEVGPRLAETRRVVLVDHRNHGLAPKTTTRYEIADLADDIAAAIATVGITHCDVVGYSMGGTIAQELAHRHPDLVDRLVLIGTFVTHPRGWRRGRQIGTYALRAWERLTGIGTAQVRAAYLILSGAVERRHAEWMWDQTHTRDIDGGAQASLSLLRFDSRPWVTSVTVPTLVVVPTKDLLVPAAWQYELAGTIPDAEVVDIAGGRHEVPWTHADRLSKEIAAFLGRPEEET